MSDFDFSCNNEEVVIEASLPVGKYVLMVSDVSANEKGTLVFKMSVVEDENGDAKYANRKVTDYKSFSPNARKWTLEAIKKMSQSAYGRTHGNKMSFNGLGDYQAAFTGKTVLVTIKHEEFNGEMSAKVGSYLPRPDDNTFVLSNLESQSETFVDVAMENKPRGGSEDDCPF